ncbi:MAG: hypothetical protein H7Y15_16595 [Pseudonocardia sp.]|nr:hypothetical protein [Pseudonocardia sp.]
MVVPPVEVVPPLVVAPPVLEALPPLPLPVFDTSPAFTASNLGFDSSVSIPTSTFSAPDMSFLNTGSFGFSGGGLF